MLGLIVTLTVGLVETLSNLNLFLYYKGKIRFENVIELNIKMSPYDFEKIGFAWKWEGGG